MNKASKKAVSIITVVALLVNTGAITVPVRAQETVSKTSDYIGITPFASDVMVSWAPLLSKTSYGVNITLKTRCSGTITVELQNSSGAKVASFTESFTNTGTVTPIKSRTTASGTYRVIFKITIDGVTTTRESTLKSI